MYWTFSRIYDVRVGLLVCAVALFASVAHAEPIVSQDTANSWIATNGSHTFIGTWTVDARPSSDTVTGTWTLVDTEGRTLAFGTWSAAKSATGWSGAWKANVDRREGTYGGTWTSNVSLKKNAQFSELFATALRAVVGGNWRFGAHSGSWSIRAYH
jgi:hypothetical protein